MQVRVKGRSHEASVREVTGAERERLWQHMVRTWPNYEKYARSTGRTIPVFLLDPVA